MNRIWDRLMWVIAWVWVMFFDAEIWISRWKLWRWKIINAFIPMVILTTQAAPLAPQVAIGKMRLAEGEFVQSVIWTSANTIWNVDTQTLGRTNASGYQVNQTLFNCVGEVLVIAYKTNRGMFQYSTNLTTWINSNVTITTTNNWIFIYDQLDVYGRPKRFYRLKQVP